MKPIKRLACLVTLLLCGYPFNTAVADELRTWTDVQGRTINARLLSADPSTSTIEIERADGTRFTLPIARLSYADQQFIQHWEPAVDGTASAAITVAPAALAELSSANWQWLASAGSITARNYVNTPADELMKLLNLRLSGASSAKAKETIKGVRLDAGAAITELSIKIPNTVGLGTFFKELAEQNDLQLRVDSAGYIVLQRQPTAPQNQEIKFLEL